MLSCCFGQIYHVTYELGTLTVRVNEANGYWGYGGRMVLKQILRAQEYGGVWEREGTHRRRRRHHALEKKRERTGGVGGTTSPLSLPVAGEESVSVEPELPTLPGLLLRCRRRLRGPRPAGLCGGGIATGAGAGGWAGLISHAGGGGGMIKGGAMGEAGSGSGDG